MAIIKCKMCGGDLELLEDSSVCECEYCGTKQTVPKADDEKKLKLFERANRLRTACEFDKAAGVYESIIADFDQEAEAYWGLILCKFGIEYVDDPATGKKIPTCHRSSFESLMDEPNFEMVMECADPIARRVYREEAKAIEELRKGIIEVSSREEPYDVFISYKELAEDGQRTLDSVIAQDIYTELTDRGYRVFFSRISLESKLGVEYEPYIFAALNSAKVMLVVGTDYDYFNAVWVKNEWSRFLALIAKGEKKTLIPVFKGIDAYDMPKEFSKLAAQDMGKVGAMQDLMRGVEKILGKKQPEAAAQPQQVIQQIVQGGANLDALLKRGFMSLEDAQWDKATELFDKVLNDDPENAQAYLGLAMAEAKARTRNAYEKIYTRNAVPGSMARRSSNAARAKQYDPKLKNWFNTLDEQYNTVLRQQQMAEQREARAEAIRKAEEQRKTEEANKRLAEFRQRIFPAAKMIAAYGKHVIGLRTDGTAVAVGDNDYGQCDVNSWKDLVAITTGLRHTVGLLSNGSVVATTFTKKEGYCGQCHVFTWCDIVEVSAGRIHTVGLKSDGTVIATGYNQDGACNVSQWRNIIAVSAGDSHTVGLRADGTVVAVGSNIYGQCDVGTWKNIVAVSAGSTHTLGLKADGTMISTKDNKTLLSSFCKVQDWKQIVAIYAGSKRSLGLKSDGTIFVEGESKQHDFSEWKDIVAVSANEEYTVGVKANGRVVSKRNSYLYDDQLDVGKWRLFDQVDNIAAERNAVKEKAEAERKAAIERARAERKAALEKSEAEYRAKMEALHKEKTGLQNELANLKGLFSGMRRRDIEARLAQIERSMSTLRTEHAAAVRMLGENDSPPSASKEEPNRPVPVPAAPPSPAKNSISVPTQNTNQKEEALIKEMRGMDKEERLLYLTEALLEARITDEEYKNIVERLGY